MMKKRTKIILIILAIIGSMIAVYYLINKKQSDAVLKAKTVEVTKGDVNTMISATGTIEPINKVEVGTQVSGVVKKVYVDYNTHVQKGQLLAELDKTNLQATLKEAQANYSTSVSQKEYLKRTYERQKELYENDLISKSDFESAEYNYKSVQGTVTQRLSELNRAKTNLSYAAIYSPIDGVVLSREVDEGQTVAASLSTPTLFTIAQDLKQMQVEADVDEADIGNVKQGQRVTFTVDAFPNETFNGEVTQVRLSPTTTSNVVTYTVVIKADNSELKLMPGLTATVNIYTAEKIDVLVLETKALNFNPDPTLIQQYNQNVNPADTAESRAQKTIPVNPEKMDENYNMVWVLEKSIIAPKQVKFGLNNGVYIEVLDGLSLYDKVVYNLSEGIVTQQGTPEQSDSPFMPKPPGKK